MPNNTYVALSTQTITGSPATSVTFSSIPQDYTDLILIVNGMSDGVNADAGLRFNGVSTTTYSRLYLYGSGSAALSGTTPNTTYSQNMNFSNVSNETNIVHIFNYSNSSVYKTMLSSTADAASLGVVRQSSTWRNTAAITSIEVLMAGTSKFAVGTTFTLYGVAAASVGAKATGGTIYQDASYFYHVFTGNGTFTPSQSLSADILVVAGGGSSGDYYGGGGGAGGLLTYTSQSLTATGYTCTVGAGGAAWSYPSTGNNGTNSQFGSLTAAVGGGYGASGGGHDGASGIGSGGSGGGGASGTITSGAAGTSGQGYAGGDSAGATGNYGGAGGGGAGAVGSNGGTNGGNGGIGATSTFINAIGFATGLGQLSSSNYYFAGGGAGAVGVSGTPGTGGIGGGGNGAFYSGASVATPGTKGTPNTGGGGGSGSGSAGTTTGGSGVIIVRYAK